VNIPAGHPAFAGHFPGRPILPAVVLLSEALAAIESATGQAPQQWTLASAKFLVPIAPGTPLTFSHESTSSGGIRFEVRSGAGVVAHGVLAPRRES
jgi:3-hydroxyacyl-[acyl-carrier-protein] dehydratase